RPRPAPGRRERVLHMHLDLHAVGGVGVVELHADAGQRLAGDCLDPVLPGRVGLLRRQALEAVGGPRRYGRQGGLRPHVVLHRDHAGATRQQQHPEQQRRDQTHHAHLLVRGGQTFTTCRPGGVAGANSCASKALSPSLSATPVAFRPVKPYKVPSSRWLGTMFCSALNMFSTRPGNFFSHSRNISPTCLRCRFSWLPHRLLGMIGKSRCAAQRAVSFSGTKASGRITTWRPSSLTSLGGMLFILPPKNMFSSRVCRMSSRWWPSAILVAPSSSATRYRMPRRRREHRLQVVLPSGMRRLTML